MNQINNAKILIVGGAGFVGSNLSFNLLKYDPKQIVIVDNLLSSEKENIPTDDRINFIEGSINDDRVLDQINEDICQGLILCALKGLPGDVYNLASGNEMTILELANLIKDITGNHTEIEFVSGRKWDHSGRRYGATEKSEMKLGFQAKTDIKSGLEHTLEWTNKNMPLIERSIKKHKEKMEDYTAGE